MDLILEKAGVLSSALSSWDNKWVPAIIQYSRTCTGKKAKVISDLAKGIMICCIE